MAPNFGSILDKPASDVERPKPYPQGSYICVVKGLPVHGESTRKKTKQVEFQLQPLSVLDDVDAEDLEAMGGLNRTIKDTYYVTEDALWRLKEFLVNCGIEEMDGDDKKSFTQMIDETPGRQVGVSIRHEASEDGKSIFARVGSTFLVE